MNMIGRRDRALLAGLALALLVVFVKPLTYLLDLAREVERSSGLALMPALIILAGVFLFHQTSKRWESKARAAAAEAEAQDAGARAGEMERLVMFGQALGRSLDVETIYGAVMQHLPALAAADDVWVMLRKDGRWHALGGGAHEADPVRAAIADRALASDPLTGVPDAANAAGHFCLPLTAGGHTVGVLGMPQDLAPFSEARRRTLAAAATLLAISLRNAQLFRDLRESSLRDGLTGCFNRAHALDVIDVELRRARRSQMPVALIMFDLDHFKDVNDRHGHLCGDAVLTAIGGKMREVLRGSDLKCRYGGEEFLVLLPETPLEGAKRVADTMRREIAEMVVPWKDVQVSITASFGVSVALPSEIDCEALISRADAALYRAKDQGRNCVRLALETAVA